MNENTQETLETVPNNIGISVNDDNAFGNDYVTETSTSIADTPISDTGADETSPNVWTNGDSTDSDSVSSGDIFTDTPYSTEELMAIQEMDAETGSQIVESLTAIHSLLVLIFAFLLFEWTEKKLKVTVNKFTDKRRK